ncbi:hypothetical protein IMSAG192_00815 [Muribaculaceae bacterium]|nr:hypothetical protein IMSAG192_00815 [Muribaculaceae bacterium]
MGAVIAGEYYQGVVVQSLLFKFCKYFAYVMVEARNHSCKLCVGMYRRIVSGAFLTSPGLVFEEPSVIVEEYGVAGLCQFGMR